MASSVSSGEAGLSESARHIAQVAARLFAAQGYDATSVRTIVEAAGVTKPTLYYHFGSKEGLAQALVTRPLTALLHRLHACVSEPGDPIAALEQSFEAHFAFCREDPDRARFVYALFFGPLGSGLAHELARISDDLTRSMGDCVRRLADARIIDAARVDDCARACRGMIVIATMEFLYHGAELGPCLARRLVGDLLRGFARPGAPDGTRGDS